MPAKIERESTNERIQRLETDIAEMIGWVEADAEHSYENGAREQEADDRRRGANLRTALELISQSRR